MSQTPEDLGQKIKEAQHRSDAQQAGQKEGSAARGGKNLPSGAGKALRASTDLVAAVVVGAFLGYWIDRWLDTTPFGMILFFFLGFGAGFMNIYRSQTGQDYKVGFKDKNKDKDKE